MIDLLGDLCVGLVFVAGGLALLGYRLDAFTRDAIRQAFGPRHTVESVANELIDALENDQAEV